MKAEEAKELMMRTFFNVIAHIEKRIILAARNGCYYCIIEKVLQPWSDDDIELIREHFNGLGYTTSWCPPKITTIKNEPIFDLTRRKILISWNKLKGQGAVSKFHAYRQTIWY